jgi:hypothetical protein
MPDNERKRTTFQDDVLMNLPISTLSQHANSDKPILYWINPI